MVDVKVGVEGAGGGEGGEKIKRGVKEEKEAGGAGVSKKVVWPRSSAINRVCSRSK